MKNKTNLHRINMDIIVGKLEHSLQIQFRQEKTKRIK